MVASWGCGKKENVVEKELVEAGYELSLDGWFGAIRDNDVEVMRRMVSAGFDAKSMDEAGRSGLHVAAGAGGEQAAEYLLNRGLSVDLVDAAGGTPLMESVREDRTAMVRYLLRQGADPKLRDGEGFSALFLAVNEGRRGAVEELAVYHREDLDSALLFASLVGSAEVIDALTNYGGSVYARMEDGRTPLMLAAENGHRAAVEMLIDIGASRFATSNDGFTAESLAVAAGHVEIAELIASGMVSAEIALESDEEIGLAMAGFLEDFSDVGDEGFAVEGELGGIAARGAVDGVEADRSFGREASEREAPVLLDGVRLGVVRESDGGDGGVRVGAGVGVGVGAGVGVENEEGAALRKAEVPLVMRHYRERDLPVELSAVSGSVATLRFAGSEPREVRVAEGERVPDTRLTVVRVFNRVEAGKLSEGRPVEVGVVEVEDGESGQRRQWISGQAASSHDPVALVEDSGTGRRFVARPGQRFFSGDGREFVVSDVRPNQLVIEDLESGEVQTLRLKGPRG